MLHLHNSSCAALAPQQIRFAATVRLVQSDGGTIAVRVLLVPQHQHLGCEACAIDGVTRAAIAALGPRQSKFVRVAPGPQ